MIYWLLLIFLANGALADWRCTSQGGTCVDYRYYVCNAGVESGLCDGDNNRRCCLDCDATCQANENNWNSNSDSACDAVGGNCQDSTNYCSGSYSSGKCGGPSERQCCSVGGSSGNCPLMTYSSNYVKGYNGLAVEVESDFYPEMGTISSIARDCSVTVWVTHAYRDAGQDLGGVVVPPSTTSNHLVGHAIDMNVETPSGWCNGDCLYAGRNSYAECFVQGVVAAGLRWGGVWSPSDPVHIDDGLNVYNYNQWETLFYDLQGKCSNVFW